MTLRSTLLTFKIQRFETTVVVGAAILSVLVSAVVIAVFTAGGYARCATDEVLSSSSFCHTLIADYVERVARWSAMIVPVYPVIAGLLIGGPIVARELESGTARLAWSLAPSRIRWFAQRAIPILLVAFLAGLAIGLTADALTHMLQPATDLDASFAGFRNRGLLVGVEALLVASIALALGAILGRIVPTIVFSLILVFAIGTTVDKLERGVLTNEAVLADSSGFSFNDDNLYIDSRLRMPDGAIVTWEELNALYPQYSNGWDETSGISDITLYIPGSRYHDVERREALAIGGIAVLFVGIATVAVLRRRPR
jgi:hypothetical protein